MVCTDVAAVDKGGQNWGFGEASGGPPYIGNPSVWPVQIINDLVTLACSVWSDQTVYCSTLLNYPNPNHNM